MNARSIDFLQTLEHVIRERKDAAAETSYTARLFQAGPKHVAQKVGEESVELALAAVAGDRGEVVNETADVLYHVLVLLATQDIELAEVVAALEERHRG